MKHSFWPLLIAAGCAGQRAEEKTTTTQPTQQKQRIVNLSYFDLINCHPPSFKVPAPVTRDALIGLMVGARPLVMECLVDPKARVPDQKVKFSVEATFSGNGWEEKISGSGLAPEGEQCVRATLEKVFENSLKRGDATTAKPVTATLEYEQVPSNPVVQWGVNQASDVAGKIRLAEKQWCECFEPWKDKAPYPLQAQISLGRGVAGSEVKFESSPAPQVATVQACLKNKISDMHLTTQSSQLIVPYFFIGLNSSVNDDLPDPAGDLKFMQLEGVRSQIGANTVIAIGARNYWLETYDVSARKYRAKRQRSMVQSLKEQCAALIKADEEWVSAMERQAAIEEKIAALSSSLKAQDPQWADADAVSHKAVADSKKDLEVARKAKAEDAQSCPKERF